MDLTGISFIIDASSLKCYYFLYKAACHPSQSGGQADPRYIKTARTNGETRKVSCPGQLKGMDSMMDFGKNLKCLLIEKHLKQADLCRMTGIQTSLMSEYIGGKKSPTIGNAILMADALDISLDTLVGRNEPVDYSVPISSPYVSELNDSVNDLTETERTFVLSVIHSMKKYLV